MAAQNEWMREYQELKAVRAKFKQKAPIMTRMEQDTMHEAIDNMINVAFPKVYRGAREDLMAKVGHFRAAQRQLEYERKNMINKINSRAVADEVDRFTQRLQAAINMPADIMRKESVAARIYELYQEAKTSGQLEKILGLSDALAAIPEANFPASERDTVSGLVRSIRRDAVASAMPEDIARAEREVLVAAEEVSQAKERIKEYATELQESIPGGVFSAGPFDQLYKMVEVTPGGQVTLYDENSPEVTGNIVITKSDAEAVGGE